MTAQYNRVQMPRGSLRILHVIPYYPPAFVYGGPVLSAHALASAQVDAGHDVHVFTTNRNGTKRLPPCCGLESNIDGVLASYFPTTGLGPFAYSAEMDRALKRRVKDFDILHIHGLYTFPTFAACRRALAGGAPYVISPRGMLDPHAIARQSWLKKRLYIKAVEARNLTGASFVHFTTEQERDLAVNVVPSMRRTEVVFNPVRIDQENLARSRGASARIWPQLAHKTLLLFMSRIESKKGLELILEAMPGLVADRSDLHLVVAGAGDAAYVEKLRDRVRSEGLGSHVSFVGFVLDAEKYALLADAAVFVLPSYSENFGNAIVEAMAAGCPVVVSKRVNLASMIAATGAGEIVDCDGGAVGAAIARLLSANQDRGRIGDAGAEWVRRNIDPATIAAEMISLYRDVLSLGASRDTG